MKEHKMTITELLTAGRKQLSCHRIQAKGLVAEVLLAYLLKSDRTFLYERREMMLYRHQVSVYNKLLDKFISGMPLAYIVGTQEFMSLPFKVNRYTLIPRPETEVLVEETIRLINEYDKSNITVLDIGTGCGNIAISIVNLSHKRDIHVFASDISAHALKVARQNARLNQVQDFIAFCQGDLFKAFEPYRLASKVDFILSNPPYISAKEYTRLPLSVRKYEPKGALYAGQNGMHFHKEIIKETSHYLKKGGYLLLEIGIRQAREIQRFIKTIPQFTDIQILPDYNRIPRVLCSRYR